MKNRGIKYTRIIETFDRLAESYGGPEGLEEVNRVALSRHARNFEGRLLDVGCGSGTFMEKYFIPEKQFLVSADFSHNMIGVAKRRLEILFGGGFGFVECVAQQLPFGDGAFDACVCINTLHNMPRWEDAEAAVAEMARVLKPGGSMLLEFRNMGNPERKRITQLYDWPHLPQKAFTFEQMKSLLSRLGVEIERRMPLYGDNARSASPAPATLGLTGRRAPRIGLLARKA